MNDKPAYAIGFMKCGRTIVLLRKNPPAGSQAWQAGKLNGVGGRVQLGEEPITAMRREWLEETGRPHAAWRRFARLTNEYCVMTFFAAEVEHLPQLPDVNDAGEAFELHDVERFARARPIDNLKWLVPLAFADRHMPFADVSQDVERRRP